MSAWLPSAPCTPQACVALPPATVSLVRRVLRCLAGFTLLAAGIALAPLVRRLPAPLGAPLVRGWSLTVAAALGVRVRATGAAEAGRGGALVVANHISWLDILLIAAVRPGRMLAKSEVARWPVAGRFVAWGGTLFIDRDRLRSLPGTVGEIGAVLRRGGRVVVFPEGSTWCGRGGGGRFRPALFQAAIDAGVPVQPVTIRYRLTDGSATSAPAFVGDDGMLSSVWRVVGARGLVGELQLAGPITASPHVGRRVLAQAAQAAVERRACGGPVPPHTVRPTPAAAGVAPRRRAARWA
ncbi:1-acyl-sn-glycerol-3-phosphate acyltransferase [Kitasatospora sp. NBC_00374]|uniref:lysophospholipid acyltransferase family protein n=1 Tax=Kitasatospora sp. NBC_00374 TaxID=2975964 RepID=UPI00325074A9